MDTSQPYASRAAFLTHGLSEIILDATLDCSICREPLAVALGKVEQAPQHLPCPPIASLSHVAIDDEFSNSCVDEMNFGSPDSTKAAPLDNRFTPESAVLVLPCKHVFGRACLMTWFITSKSNCCPECNQELFPNRQMHLFLREPTRSMRIEFAKYIEETCGDYGTAEEIRGNLMSEWTRSLIREFAMELWRQQGYEVEYQYVGGAGAEEEEHEGLTDEDDEEGDESGIHKFENDDEELKEDGGAMGED